MIEYEWNFIAKCKWLRSRTVFVFDPQFGSYNSKAFLFEQFRVRPVRQDNCIVKWKAKDGL